MLFRSGVAAAGYVVAAILVFVPEVVCLFLVGVVGVIVVLSFRVVEIVCLVVDFVFIVVDKDFFGMGEVVGSVAVGIFCCIVVGVIVFVAEVVSSVAVVVFCCMVVGVIFVVAGVVSSVTVVVFCCIVVGVTFVVVGVVHVNEVGVVSLTVVKVLCFAVVGVAEVVVAVIGVVPFVVGEAALRLHSISFSTSFSYSSF